MRRWISIIILLLGILIVIKQCKHKEGYTEPANELPGFTIYQVYNQGAITTDYSVPTVTSSSTGQVSFNWFTYPFYLAQNNFIPSNMKKLYVTKDNILTYTAPASPISLQANAWMPLLQAQFPLVDVFVHSESAPYILVGESTKDVDVTQGTNADGWSVYYLNKPLMELSMKADGGSWRYYSIAIPPNTKKVQSQDVFQKPQASFKEWQDYALANNYTLLNYPLSQMVLEPKAFATYVYLGKIENLTTNFWADGFERFQPLQFLGESSTSLCLPFRDGKRPRVGKNCYPSSSKAWCKTPESTPEKYTGYSLNSILIQATSTGSFRCLSDDGVNCLPGMCWDGKSCMDDICYDVTSGATSIQLPKMIPKQDDPNLPAQFNLANTIFGEESKNISYQLDMSKLSYIDCPEEVCAPAKNDSYFKQFVKLKNLAKAENMGLFVFVKELPLTSIGNVYTSLSIGGPVKNVCLHDTVQDKQGHTISLCDLTRQKMFGINVNASNLFTSTGSYLRHQSNFATMSGSNISFKPQDSQSLEFIPDEQGRLRTFENIENCMTLDPDVTKTILYSDTTEYQDNVFGIFGENAYKKKIGYKYDIKGYATINSCATDDMFQSRWRWNRSKSTLEDDEIPFARDASKNQIAPPEQVWKLGISPGNIDCSIGSHQQFCKQSSDYLNTCVDQYGGSDLKSYSEWVKGCATNISKFATSAEDPVFQTIKEQYEKSQAFLKGKKIDIPDWPRMFCNVGLGTSKSDIATFCKDPNVFVQDCLDLTSNSPVNIYSLMNKCSVPDGANATSHEIARQALLTKGYDASKLPQLRTVDCNNAVSISEVAKDPKAYLEQCPVFWTQTGQTSKLEDVITSFNEAIKSRQVSKENYDKAYSYLKSIGMEKSILRYTTVDCSVYDQDFANGYLGTRFCQDNAVPYIDGCGAKADHKNFLNQCVQKYNQSGFTKTKYDNAVQAYKTRWGDVEGVFAYTDVKCDVNPTCSNMYTYMKGCSEINPMNVSKWKEFVDDCRKNQYNATNRTEYDSMKTYLQEKGQTVNPLPTVDCSQRFKSNAFCNNAAKYMDECNADSDTKDTDASTYRSLMEDCLSNKQMGRDGYLAVRDRLRKSNESSKISTSNADLSTSDALYYQKEVCSKLNPGLNVQDFYAWYDKNCDMLAGAIPSQIEMGKCFYGDWMQNGDCKLNPTTNKYEARYTRGSIGKYCQDTTKVDVCDPEMKCNNGNWVDPDPMNQKALDICTFATNGKFYKTQSRTSSCFDKEKVVSCNVADACAKIALTDKAVPQYCINQVWKNAGCSTPAPVMNQCTTTVGDKRCTDGGFFADTSNLANVSLQDLTNKSSYYAKLGY